MTPELRKEASELQLHKRGIRINVQLHVIEADEEVRLRTSEEVASRLIALWAVSQAALSGDRHATYAFLQAHNLTSLLSAQEFAFLTQDTASEALQQQCLERLHAFHFLAWCAGLLDKIDLSPKPIATEKILQHFPSIHAIHDDTGESSTPAHLLALLANLGLRRKTEIMDWADLLYRLHWAVRHATLNGKPSPGNIDATMVREWHQAVNWICNYDDENNWDAVSTETTA